MDKKKKELILLVVLIPVLIFVVYNTVTTTADRPSARPRPADQDPAPIPPAGPPPIPRSAREEPEVPDQRILERQAEVAEEPWDRNPFQPPPERESERPAGDYKEFRLSGIIEGRMAIINGEPVYLGEEYRGYRLQRAEQYRIVLEKDDQTFIITISEE